MSSLSIFMFYLANNLLYWLYCLKQWIISVQFPQMMIAKPSKQELKE
jgi:hypothetical protein